MLFSFKSACHSHLAYRSRSSLRSRSSSRSGFTVIEVMLFLAISGLMFAGLLAGAGSSIARQRYKDSVQDFTEFIRGVYSSALAVENFRQEPIFSNDVCNIRSEDAIRSLSVDQVEKISNVDLYAGLPGRTNCVFYGKLITVGEDSEAKDGTKSDTIFVYDLIGKLYKPDIDHPKDTISTITMPDSGHQPHPEDGIQPEALVVTPDKSLNCQIRPARSVTYRPQWKAFLEQPDGHKFSGSIAILRSPESNQLQTFYAKTIPAIKQNSNQTISCSSFSFSSYKSASLTQLFTNGDFEEPSSGVDFCLNSPDIFAAGSQRRNIHIAYRTSNPSAVELRPQDSEENKCRK